MWSLFIFSFLLGLTLADVSAVLHGNGTHGGHPGGLNLTSGCGYRQFFNNQWDQSGINEWLARELRTFNADSNDDQFFVKDYMRLKYANMTTPQMGDCTAATGCLVSITNIEPTGSDQVIGHFKVRRHHMGQQNRG